MIAARVLVNISDLLVMNSKVIAPITKEIAKDDAKWTMNQAQIPKVHDSSWSPLRRFVQIGP